MSQTVEKSRSAAIGREVRGHDAAIEAGTDRPRREWVVGVCPECSGELVQNSYRLYDRPGVAGSGPDGGRTIQVRECWNSLGAVARRTCGYRVEKDDAGYQSGCPSAEALDGKASGKGAGDNVDSLNRRLV